MPRGIISNACQSNTISRDCKSTAFQEGRSQKGPAGDPWTHNPPTNFLSDTGTLRNTYRYWTNLATSLTAKYKEILETAAKVLLGIRMTVDKVTK